MAEYEWHEVPESGPFTVPGRVVRYAPPGERPSTGSAMVLVECEDDPVTPEPNTEAPTGENDRADFDLEDADYRDLQERAKEFGIKANQSAETLVDLIAAAVEDEE